MNTTLAGDLLEKRIFELISRLISEGEFFAKPENCKVFRQKGYHSKDRGSDIVFDVAIEVYLPGATLFSFLVLIECKNYSHPVPVSDIEEFYSKVQQVAAANCKAVLASTAAFQSGSLNFARSKGVGLLRYFDPKDFKWVLLRSPSAGHSNRMSRGSGNVIGGLTIQSFQSQGFDLYMQTTNLTTNSLGEFIKDLAISSTLSPQQALQFFNTQTKRSYRVPFVSKDELESKSDEILRQIGYAEGQVSLDAICEMEASAHGLRVIYGGKSGTEHATPILGQITFSPLEIQIFQHTNTTPGRERFTLAHELAHHFMGHARYMSSECCDDDDFSFTRADASITPDIARMEYQANFLASCLLMPKASFVGDFLHMSRALRISDKGFGPLFVDDQPCNLENFERITRELMSQYGVSRRATALRLEGLGLLHDVRLNSASGLALRPRL